MEKTDEYMLNRITWKTGQQGNYRGDTYFFDELSDTMKAYLKSNIQEERSGIPVLLFTKSTRHWTLLCTRQVIGCAGGYIFSIQFKDIFEISPFLTKERKVERNELMVLDKNKKAYIFHTSNGYGHITLHSILLMCSRMAN